MDSTIFSAGEVFNIGDPDTRSIRGWATEILAAAGHTAELVTVPESVVKAQTDVSAAEQAADAAKKVLESREQLLKEGTSFRR